MSQLQVQIANTALKNLLGGKHFNICAIDKIADMLGINVRGQAYKMLAALHCVDYDAMPVDVRDAIPQLIRDAFHGVRFDEVTIVDANLRRIGERA